MKPPHNRAALVWHDQFKTSVLAQGTGANRGNGGGNQNLCFLRSLLLQSGSGGLVELDFDKSISDGVNIYAKRDGDACLRGEGSGYGRQADFVFLARDTAPALPKSDEGGSPYIDNRLPALHSLGEGGREYKAVYVQSDAEIGLFSDEVVVNCAP